MIAKQLSVFIENRKGRMEEVLSELKNGNVNILSLSLADTTEYGLLRLIVDNPINGKNTLDSKGFSSMLTDVLVVKISQKVGSLVGVISNLSKNNINIEYMYGLTLYQSDASIVLKTDDLEKTNKILADMGVETLSNEKL